MDDAENDLKKRDVRRRRKTVSDRNAWKLNLKVAKVHSVEQKSIGLKFSKSRTGSDVR